ncbi:hypothetical protein Y1Q_0002323 [Alligator mississippiensis]|uniref:Uncharacterized protein n=1 Tax=Alligator mississippiensis TaxID=8496 RepID=A0A151MGP4_ALLMI|nr:hypothetical protein Y1Q_0002323 [Alligator mississippiensis]
MAISPAPEVFQHKLNRVLEELSGIRIIVDDILIVGDRQSKKEAIQGHDAKGSTTAIPCPPHTRCYEFTCISSLLWELQPSSCLDQDLGP